MKCQLRAASFLADRWLGLPYPFTPECGVTSKLSWDWILSSRWASSERRQIPVKPGDQSDWWSSHIGKQPPGLHVGFSAWWHLWGDSPPGCPVLSFFYPSFLSLNWGQLAGITELLEYSNHIPHLGAKEAQLQYAIVLSMPLTLSFITDNILITEKLRNWCARPVLWGEEPGGQGKEQEWGKSQKENRQGWTGCFGVECGQRAWTFSSFIVTPFVKEVKAVGQVYYSSLGFGILNSKMGIIRISFLLSRLEDSVRQCVWSTRNTAWNKGNNKGSLSLLLLLFDRRINEGTSKWMREGAW